MRVGQARRRDENEPAIIDALRAVGAEVWQISGKSLPDLLVRRRGVLYAFEVKTVNGRRTKAQKVSLFPIVTSPDEALMWIGVS